MVVLAAPVSKIGGLLADLAPTDALVTDVGSAKATIVRDAALAGLRRFVGGHPMAGSALAGVANANADLFRGARYLLTPTAETRPTPSSPSSSATTWARCRARWTPTAMTCWWRPCPISPTSSPSPCSRSPPPSPPRR